MPPTIASGDVVLIRARVRAVYPEQGIITVRTVMPGSGLGFRQEVVALEAVERKIDDPDDERLVPRKSW